MDSAGDAMIPFRLADEPPAFDEKCRQPGMKWLAENPGYDRPKDYWSPFERDLYRAFNSMCGWTAMTIMRGQVDHFIPVATLKQAGLDKLAYEWSNFRYIDGWINQKKWTARVLDPFDVQVGWFRILLPSMQLVATESIPAHFKDLAEFTLERLGLRDHEVIVRYRKMWFDMYRNEGLQLDSLRSRAPLIAEAVERDLNAGIDWRNST
jgi:hypothetical protein